MPTYKITKPNLVAKVDGANVRLEVGKEYTFDKPLNHRGRAVEVGADTKSKTEPKLEVATPKKPKQDAKAK